MSQSDEYMKTELEQAKDLLSKLRAASLAMRNTGLRTVSGAISGDFGCPSQYRESEVRGRYVAIQWMLLIATNEAAGLVKDWREEDRRP